MAEQRVTVVKYGADQNVGCCQGREEQKAIGRREAVQKQQYSMVVKGGRMAWRERGQAIFQHICIVFSLVLIVFNFMFPLLLAKIYQVSFFVKVEDLSQY